MDNNDFAHSELCVYVCVCVCRTWSECSQPQIRLQVSNILRNVLLFRCCFFCWYVQHFFLSRYVCYFTLCHTTQNIVQYMYSRYYIVVYLIDSDYKFFDMRPSTITNWFSKNSTDEIILYALYLYCAISNIGSKIKTATIKCALSAQRVFQLYILLRHSYYFIGERWKHKRKPKKKIARWSFTILLVLLQTCTQKDQKLNKENIY